MYSANSVSKRKKKNRVAFYVSFIIEHKGGGFEKSEKLNHL